MTMIISKTRIVLVQYIEAGVTKTKVAFYLP